MPMRDWAKTLRHASFRGVPFWVDGEDPEVGRRVVAHEISGGDASLTEDMGARTKTIFVEAYVAGDLADVAGHALERACGAPGASLLILPMDAGETAHCLSCSRSRRKDRNGFIAYRLEFMKAGGAVAFTASGLGQLRTAFDAGVAAVSVLIAAQF
jgi:prophage DNA circulation protein